MINFTQAYVGGSILALVYAILKERIELGCPKGFKLEKHCDDLKSIYMFDALPKKSDSKRVLTKKLISLLSMHEKAAVWRKCFIIGTVITVLTKGLSPDIDDKILIALHLSTVAILYFYHNFMNFHVYRQARNVGLDIIKRLDLSI